MQKNHFLKQFQRKQRFLKRTAMVLLVSVVNQVLFPITAFALTGGPSQPEVKGFEPVGTSNMVDLFTGDMNYNIPLMDVGGYPLNLAYRAGASMDEEASWVGLGWSLNPGVLNREMRGIPDDFKGDLIRKDFHVKPDVTTSFQAAIPIQLFGQYTDKLTKEKKNKFGKSNTSIKIGGTYNSYTGFGLNYGLGLSTSWQLASNAAPATATTAATAATKSILASAGLNLGYGAKTGLEIQPSVGLKTRLTEHEFNLNFGAHYNSRQGLKDLSMAADVKGIGDGKENAGKHGSLGLGSGSYDFAVKTYVPAPKMPMVTHSKMFQGTLGTEWFGAHPSFQIQGSYSKQALRSQEEKRQSYGYLHQQFGKDDPSSILDYNQERPIAYRQSQPKLPLSYGTYDLFSASGQGLSGQFRVMRNDVGTLRSPKQILISQNNTLGVELGLGNAAHGGFETKGTTTTATSGDWSADKGAAQHMEFSDILPNQPDYEPAYFKSAGEPITEQAQDGGLRQRLNQHNPVSLALVPERDGARAKTTLNNGGLIDQPVRRTARQKRNQLLSYLTAQEATSFGLDKKIKSYTPALIGENAALPQINAMIERLEHPGHHISEAMVTQSDGSRYVYGIPAYNQFQKEVSFSVADATNPNGGLITYDTGDNTLNNQKGSDLFYDAQTLPKYAHSFLLTGILSPDYVDVSNNGISDDDIGTAVKFNYSRVHQNFGWRTPFGPEPNTARHQEGFEYKNSDDKAHYVYGQKEIWYVHSVETKTMVARFITSDREDALGVANENGAIDLGKKLKRLDKIQLFSKADLIAQGTNAVPVKTVHFNYNYKLCAGIANSTAADGGKLTLKTVHFTYGKNTGGALNKYSFEYHNEGVPNMYSLEHYDRWGNYKPLEANVSGLSNSQFPYAAQSREFAAKAAEAWNLNKVHLPSGGTIQVEYESDDYAYVQNKRAGQMFPILGFTANVNSSLKSTLFENGHEPNHFVCVAVPAGTSDDDFRRHYLSEVEKLYFNCRIQFKENFYERVQGYAAIQKEGAMVRGTVGYIPMIFVNGNINYKYNPIYKIAMQKLRLEMSDVISPEQNMADQEGNIILYLRQIVGIFPEIYRKLRGMDAIGVEEGLCKYVLGSESWVRLSNPNFKKYGGGHRVHKISINNYWNGSNAEAPNNHTYGQIYNYTLEDNPNHSSGVAAYEPSIGGDENPFRNQTAYTQAVALAPNNTYYIEEPIGESLFPAPVVGYSRVSVANIQPRDVQLGRTGTGHTVHEFFTAKDFPTFVEHNNKIAAPYKPNLGQRLLSFFKFDKREMLGVSQGYTVEANDMHGKPKKERIFNAKGSEIAWTKYEYKQRDAQHLQNEGIPMVRPNGEVVQGAIGVDMDVWHEMYEDHNLQEASSGTSFNTEAFFIGIFPIILPPAWAYGQREIKQFRSSVLTKYIKHFGILDKVVKMENGATVETNNELWDAETGQVLLTRTQNEFKDPLYQLSLPAHWAYDAGMGMACKNAGMLLQNVAISNGTVSQFGTHLTPGDDLIALQNGLAQIATVIQQGNQLQISDARGNPLTGTYDLKVIRSGRRNQQSASIGALVSKNNPVENNQLNINNLANVIQAQAVVFKDNWAVRGGYKSTNCNQPTLSIHSETPFKTFLAGLVAKKSSNQTLPIPTTIATAMPSLSQVFSEPNANVSLLELTPNPLVQPPHTEQSFFDVYRLSIGERCVLEIKPSTGTHFSFNDYPTPTITRSNSNLLQWTMESSKGLPPLTVTLNCKGCATLTCESLLASNDMVNPYRLGMKGNWRPAETYALYTNRTPDNWNEPNTKLRTDGVVSNFESFWLRNTTGWQANSVNNLWKRTNVITQYDTKGNEVETKDALNIYSSALYRYKNTLAAAVTANARLRETAFDGFEDYTFLNPTDACYPEHWDFARGYSNNLTTDKAHTGKFALKIGAGSTISKITPIQTATIANNDAETDAVEGTQVRRVFPNFGLGKGDYLVSAWVSTANNNIQSLSNIQLNANGVNLQPTGKIVEGWQRIEGVFTVPDNASQIELQVINGANTPIYLDDIRILPVAAKMKSFVYDAQTMRLMAQLDENNYATFYEYDDEGSLIRTKRETERGIMTLQENRNFMRPSN